MLVSLVVGIFVRVDLVLTFFLRRLLRLLLLHEVVDLLLVLLEQLRRLTLRDRLIGGVHLELGEDLADVVLPEEHGRHVEVLPQLVHLGLGGLPLDLALHGQVSLVGRCLFDGLGLRGRGVAFRGGAHVLLFADAVVALLHKRAGVIESTHGDLCTVFTVLASDQVSAVQVGERGIGLDRQGLELLGLSECALFFGCCVCDSGGGQMRRQLVDLLLQVLKGPLLALLHLDEHLLHLLELLEVVGLDFVKLCLLLRKDAHGVLAWREERGGGRSLAQRWVGSQARLRLRLPAPVKLVGDDGRLHDLTLQLIGLHGVRHHLQRRVRRHDVTRDLSHVCEEWRLHKLGHHRRES